VEFFYRNVDEERCKESSKGFMKSCSIDGILMKLDSSMYTKPAITHIFKILALLL